MLQRSSNFGDITRERALARPFSYKHPPFDILLWHIFRPLLYCYTAGPFPAMARQGDGNGGGDASSDRRRVHHTPVIVVTNTAITDTVAQVLSGIKDQPVQSQTRPKSVSEARNALKPPRRCSIHNVPSLPSITESASQQASRRTYQVSPGSRYDPPPSEPSRPPSIGKEQENSQHITFAPVADNKVVF